MQNETLQIKPTAFLDFHYEYVEVYGRFFRVSSSGWIQRWTARHLSEQQRLLYFDDPTSIPEDRWSNCQASRYGKRKDPVINVSYQGFSRGGKAIKCNRSIQAVEVVAAAYFEEYLIKMADPFQIKRRPEALEYSLIPQELEVYDRRYSGRMTYERNPFLQKGVGERYFAMHKTTKEYHYVLPGEVLTEPDSYRSFREVKDAFLTKLAHKGEDFLEVYRSSYRDRFSTTDLGKWEELLVMKKEGKLVGEEPEDDPSLLPTL